MTEIISPLKERSASSQVKFICITFILSFGLCQVSCRTSTDTSQQSKQAESNQIPQSTNDAQLSKRNESNNRAHSETIIGMYKMAYAVDKLGEKASDSEIRNISVKMKETSDKYCNNIVVGSLVGAAAGVLAGKGAVAGAPLGALIGSNTRGSKKLDENIGQASASDISDASTAIERSNELANVIRTKWKPNTSIFSCYADYDQCNRLGMSWTRCAPALWICAMETILPNQK